MDRIDRLAAEYRSESFDLGYFDGSDDREHDLPYDDGRGKGTSEEYRHGYSVGYDPFPVPGSAITCGSRADLPRKQRRHQYVDMGDDFKNKGTEGIVQMPVTACARCGHDKR